MLLKTYYVRLDVKQSATLYKGSPKITVGANIKKFKPQMLSIWLQIVCNEFHPKWVSPHHPFDDVSRVKLCFQSSTPPFIPSHMY